MKVGSVVKVTDLKSMFHGRKGIVQQLRREESLAYGVRLEGAPAVSGLWWFRIQEIEEVS